MDALMSENADLLVMGAYTHSRCGGLYWEV